MRRTSLISRLVPGLTVVLLLAAGCGGASTPDRAANSSAGRAGNGAGNSAGNAGDNAASSLAKFAKCVREHGQNVPDPDPNSDFSLTPPGGGPNPQWDVALRACREFLPGGGAPQAPDQSELDGLRAYAGCMRSHGIEMTDPDPATGRSQFEGRLANANRQQILGDPGYQRADQACRGKLGQPEGK